MSTRFTLRPYQVECINAVLSELGRGEFTRLGVSAPTGESSRGRAAMQRVQPVERCILRVILAAALRATTFNVDGAVHEPPP